MGVGVGGVGVVDYVLGTSRGVLDGEGLRKLPLSRERVLCIVKSRSRVRIG